VKGLETKNRGKWGDITFEKKKKKGRRDFTPKPGKKQGWKKKAAKK